MGDAKSVIEIRRFRTYWLGCSGPIKSCGVAITSGSDRGLRQGSNLGVKKPWKGIKCRSRGGL